MNSKGQVLVLFVLLFPIIIILFALVIDLGLLSIEKRNISNNVSDAVTYYLNNKEDSDISNKVEKLLNENLDNISIDIKDDEKSVEIIVSKEYKSIFNVFLKRNISITYKGIKDTNKVIKG